MALLVAHYDVLAGIPLSGEVSPYTMGERFLAERLLGDREASDLLLYDRGFPSYAMFALHQARKVPVCMRLPRRFNRQVDQFIDDGDSEREITLTPASHQRKDARALGIEAMPVTLRLVRVRLKSDEIEVLATSLRDNQRYPAHLFKELYAKRWGVEEGFKALKAWALVETFRTRGATVVHQEVYARLLMLTLAAMAGQLAQARVDQRTAHCRNAYKINGLALLRKWRSKLCTLWRQLAEAHVFDAFLIWVAEDANPVRPGRSYERKSRNVNPLPARGA